MKFHFNFFKPIEWGFHIELADYSKSVKVFVSQVFDKRPINNPIQGRCY